MTNSSGSVWSMTCTCSRLRSSIWAPTPTLRPWGTSSTRSGTSVDIHSRTTVTDVDRETHQITACDAEGEHQFTADRIIFAVGRAGSNFFSGWCREKRHSPAQQPGGHRRAGRAARRSIWEDFSKKIYEPKILYRSKQYGDTTRMFCFNERGQVVTENTDGVLTVNGHAFRERGEKRPRTPTSRCSPPSALPSPSTPPSNTPAMWQALPTSSAAAACWYSAWAT